MALSAKIYPLVVKGPKNDCKTNLHGFLNYIIVLFFVKGTKQPNRGHRMTAKGKPELHKKTAIIRHLSGHNDEYPHNIDLLQINVQILLWTANFRKALDND
jgi:hypothetical protein